MTQAMRPCGLLLVLLAMTRTAAETLSGFGSSMLAVTDASILERLKSLYVNKLRPLEKKSSYHELREPVLSDAWFDSRPMVLLLGQYSVGKTSFIRYLLGRDFPNQHIGPEPTTDRFIVVMYGDREKVTPGNALTSQPDTPFHSLRNYGTHFLDRLQASSVPAPIMRRITLVDSPGVQAGEKQKGRGYDFHEVIKWFAQHSDRVLLLFDPHKLDISDEFRAVIEVLQAHQAKVRVVLNKADEIEPQKLMRVYGALMWSLGAIIASPEVPRVYLGSFWDAPFKHPGMAGLMEAEEADLIEELASLPEDNVMNKINEIARRARLVQVHVHLMAFMREQVTSKWTGRKQVQEWICSAEGMRHCYETTLRQHSLSKGDFPPWEPLARALSTFDFSQLYKPSVERSQKLKLLDELMETDIPQLIQQLHMVQKRNEKAPHMRQAFQPSRQHRGPPPALGQPWAGLSTPAGGAASGAADMDTTGAGFSGGAAAAQRSASISAAWQRQKEALAAAVSSVREARGLGTPAAAAAPTAAPPPLPPPASVSAATTLSDSAAPSQIWTMGFGSDALPRAEPPVPPPVSPPPPPNATPPPNAMPQTAPTSIAPTSSGPAWESPPTGSTSTGGSPMVAEPLGAAPTPPMGWQPTGTAPPMESPPPPPTWAPSWAPPPTGAAPIAGPSAGSLGRHSSAGWDSPPGASASSASPAGWDSPAEVMPPAEWMQPAELMQPAQAMPPAQAALEAPPPAEQTSLEPPSAHSPPPPALPPQQPSGMDAMD